MPGRPLTPLPQFHPAVRSWFQAVFPAPTRPQLLGWSAIGEGHSTLLCAPTGSGKTLAAFLWCLDRLMFSDPPPPAQRCRVLYISPIKALAIDVERNLRSPLTGIANEANKQGSPVQEPAIAIRTGDTSSAERARFSRHPSDILITTPESLYLLLTSNAREALRSIETVIVDEIHALVGTKRGAHLAVSLERLEHLCGRPLQRIGLSATQRPLEEVARFLGGKTTEFRPVNIVDASEPKRFDLRVEVPIDDMTRLDELDLLPSGPASQGPVRPSIWSAIYPKLLELVRAHRSTIIFVNSRRLAERVSGAINDLAGETLVRAHHGSVAAAQRAEIEDRLKLGTLRGIVATSSLELGIDMGAVDLVVQIEAPSSVASGMQRVGRANHNVGGVSSAVIYPKYRGDLAACAAITKAMHEGQVESVQYPRNPLDVLSQQIVAMVAMDPWDEEKLFDVVCQAASYAELPRSVFESVLDMLSGRYPSDEFVELRPRVTWDRVAHKLTAREGARSVAVVNGGTIPDRGLFGVFLAGATRGARVGELDEEMVFESRTGDTVILGATTWRIDQIDHNRVLVSPAPGEPGKMPFWHGDRAGRPSEFGQKIGEMTRELLAMPRPVAYTRLIEDHSLDALAAENLLRYLEDQQAATGQVPSDRNILIERCHDELGDWRICVLTPFGSRVHAPWCMAVAARLRDATGVEAESMWSDDGFVIRLPENEDELDPALFLPTASEMREAVMRQLGGTSLFAAKFREAAGRALLLPKRRAGMRAPLWQQRKRSADLMAVASRYPSFPILMETYRECLSDVFDLAATSDILRQIERGAIKVTTVTSQKPSPYASSLLFNYIANYIYDGDAPMAERRAQALSIDQSQLEEILGSVDFRELLDRAALEEVESQLQSLDPDYHAKHADGIHDLLLKLGDLTQQEVADRSAADVVSSLEELMQARRVLATRIAGDHRFIPVEYAAAYRDALGIPLPPGLAGAFLQAVEDPIGELVRRFARTHGPFTTQQIAARLGVAQALVQPPLRALHAAGKLLEGEFRPGGEHREWCDPAVLQQIRRKTLARLRKEVVPAEQEVFARFLGRWQGVTTRRRGQEALIGAIEVLQGAELIVSDLEREILPARVSEYRPQDLDELLASGEIVWVGRSRVGEKDGRVSLFVADSLALLLPPSVDEVPLSPRAQLIRDFLQQQGASFLTAIHAAAGGGFLGDTVEALWELVWSGYITNDTFLPVRTYVAGPEKRHAKIEAGGPRPGSVDFLRRQRSRTGGHPAAQGRWSLVQHRLHQSATPTEISAATTQQLLVRNGIVTRETAIAENIPGGYPSIYPTLRTMEESGMVRRGMFVAGLGAAQFAMPSAVDLLRSLRKDGAKTDTVHLAASDPANPYGSLLPWSAEAHSMSRTAGASVILVNGRLCAFFRRRNPSVRVFLPEDEPERSHFARELAKKFAEVAIARQSRRGGLLIAEINDRPAKEHFLARMLEDAGFVDTAAGFQMRRAVTPIPSPAGEDYEEEETA
ncbi:MAG TPA: DEAD/DEAH box helicase [Bryobacteraceae bacterium]|jgi:ATP-dependent Lhr-like helicase|nr:DEAD/DEAH box helicase [Bryobacteraceae bacterium]